jgi:hypothetical protein
MCFHLEHHDERTLEMVTTPHPELTLNTFWMAYQTITKMVKFIKDLKIQIHGIPYIVMFVVMKNNILDSSYSMLLS